MENPDDKLFREIGLGAGSSQRAKELVILGLLSEFKTKKRRGRPEVIITKDMKRADRILGVIKLTGRSDLSQVELINVARQIERILIDKGQEVEILFSEHGQSDRALKNSVSAGLKALGENL